MGIFDNYSFDWSYGDSPVGNAISDYMMNDRNSNTSIIGDAINNYATSKGGNPTSYNMDLGKLVNTIGRLGTGLGTGIAALQNQNQPNYILDTHWLGNGLANSSLRSTNKEKQNMLDQIFGAGNMLGNIFGKGYSLFGNNNGNLSTNLSSDIYSDYNPYISNGTAIGNAINDYMRK